MVPVPSSGWLLPTICLAVRRQVLHDFEIGVADRPGQVPRIASEVDAAERAFARTRTDPRRTRRTKCQRGRNAFVPNRLAGPHLVLARLVPYGSLRSFLNLGTVLVFIKTLYFPSLVFPEDPAI